MANFSANNKVLQLNLIHFRARTKLEKAYEQLLSTNENLLDELTNAVQQKKSLEVERAEILKANEDLFDETERLNDAEAKWNEERSELEQKNSDLNLLTQNLRRELDEKNSGDERDAEIASLRDERSGLVEAVTRLEADNERLADEFRKVSETTFELQKMLTHLEGSMAAKVKALEKENKLLKSTPGDNDKVADLVEKNNALTEWRRQLVEKNQNLVSLADK